ncbi:TetR/AcrR family transcriptional regulator [Rothia aeria]|uniref:TetR/AcrR family transcriptional regulator n=1 Tax=Rothia aeria TaxID=172042 RepID=UPI0003FCF8ED|nr:TetR/AcrR family transcriptional regulator [Rothia aeria]QXW92908.1 TetR/AcrR family transcriptional regulator [Rothia aeria]
MEGQRAAQREATVSALVTEARQRFARDGYTSVRIDDIVSSLGITKGALYHHFKNKKDLFRAVVCEVQQDVGRQIEDAARSCATPWEELVEGSKTFILASIEPNVRRIMLVDAPAVLGWHEWRALDESSSMVLLADILKTLMEQEIIAKQSVEPLSHLLSGAMNEAALWLAETDSPDALEDTMKTLTRLLESLRISA